MPDAPDNRERPQVREPSKCMNGWNYGERLAQEAVWLPATRGLEKDSDRAITATAEAVCVAAHLVPPGSLWPKQLCHLHTQLSLGQSCHRQKKKERKKKVLHLHVQSFQLFPTLCNPVDCELPAFSVRGPGRGGGSPGKNTGVYWPTLVAIPF